MKIALIIFLSLFVSGRSECQLAWDHIFQDTTSCCDQRIVECNDGSFLLAGTVKHQGNWGVVGLKKISSDGIELYEKYYHRNWASVFGLIHLPSDNVILFLDRDDNLYEFLKISSGGDSIGSVIFSSSADYSNGLKAVWNQNSAIYLAGNAWGTNPFGDPYGGFFYRKVDTNGVALTYQINSYYTSLCWSANQFFNATGLSVNSVDQIWFAYNRHFGYGPCVPIVAMVTTDNSGDSLFTNHLINEGSLSSLTCTYDNGCLADRSILTGNTDTLIKFSAEGITEWKFDLQNSGGAIIQTNDGNVLVASNGLRIRKIEMYGDEFWNLLLNADAASKLGEVIQSGDSSFVLVGTRQNDSTGFEQTYVAKTLSDNLLGVNEIQGGEKNLQIDLLPNPSGDRFNIILRSVQQSNNIHIRISSLLGKDITEFSTERISNLVYQVNASAIISGIYMIELLEGDNILAVGKWIKQ